MAHHMTARGSTGTLALFLCASATAALASEPAHAQVLDRAGLVTLTDYQNGSLRSEVLLPCGQAYVEVFQRNAGVQVTAQDITASEAPVAGGYCTYSAVTAGFSPYTLSETRFYSYRPGEGGVFTPGPDEDTWRPYTYGMNPIGATPNAVQPGGLLVAELPDGGARFDLYAPSGQAYVEIFGRQNGLQNVAGGVTATETAIGNGFSRYSRAFDGYAEGDLIDVRAYNYLPGTSGVFFPGPSAATWIEHTYGADGETFATTDTMYDLAAQTGSDIDVYFGHATSHIVRYSFGWYLDRARLPSLTVPLRDANSAALLGVYVRTCDSGEWVPIDDLASFKSSSATEAVSAGLYQYRPVSYPSQLPGTRVDPTYECGGRSITIPTYIGPQTLTTEAKVHYAYVVKHYARGR